jgi:hypothetical protein
LDNTTDDFYSVWKTCVNQYSKCHLTIKTDKLVAISGIAKFVGKTLSSDNTYLAGLWESEHILHMLWSNISRLKGTRVKTYRAPSWSWACLDDAEISFYMLSLEYDDKEIVSIATILHASTTPLNDPFGQISSAIIRLRAEAFFRVELCMVPNTDGGATPRDQSTRRDGKGKL